MRYLSCITLFALLPLTTALAQGPLAPPAAPAPTMKTLDQVEPRIPIGQADVPMTLTNKGSYLLTSNLILPGATAITIDADDVTLDLNGFTIDAAFSGIVIASGRERGHIRNGTIRDAGDVGINGPQANNFRLSNLRIFDCFNSVLLGDDAHLIDCLIDTSNEGAVGLERNALVRNCAFYRCGQAGEVTLYVSDGSQVHDCTFIENYAGIVAANGCVIADNLCRSNAFTQIRVTGSGNRIIDNQIVDGLSRGLWITGSGNEVSGNMVRGNADNYDFAAGNQLNLLLSEIPESIDWPASVTLAGSLKLPPSVNSSGITLNASDITIDLDGHVLEATSIATTASGIRDGASGLENIEIRSGTLRGWAGGAVALDTTKHCRLAGLRATDTGVSFPSGPAALSVGENSTIKGCIAFENSGTGISVGAGSVVEACVASDNFLFARGIFAGSACTIRNCTTTGNGKEGIVAGIDSTVSDCTVVENVGGIQVNGKCTVEGNQCAENGFNASDYGIQVNGSNNRIIDNHIVDQRIGLDINAAGNYVAGNTVMGNEDNYDLAAGNQLNLLLGELPESIDWPASVKLAGTLTVGSTSIGIAINASDVTIDLDGHALVGAAGSQKGIAVQSAQRNIAIRNGTVRNWGGMGVDGSSADNSIYTDLLIRSNGWAVASPGLRVGDNSVVTRCVAEANKDDGIRSNAGCTLTDCTVRENGGAGIHAGLGAAILDCTASANEGAGFELSSGASIDRCNSRDNQGDGILASSDCRISNNTCDNNGATPGDGAGVHVTGSDNRIDGNTVTDNDGGLDVDSTGNLIVRNSASGNSSNYSQVVAGNTMGEVVDTTGVGGTLDENDSPWANFSF